ncbi:PREDICTED: cell wall integrity and stress response component 4-like [Amphimedon queenslandica]|uniref:Ephrin RBD domain-containing protein n=1 Tax=Amphimedon queenslandica TaxID=400682 RepID=A0AAN0IVJ9_AMPQE|nr:PREDICTED: cell wall integrity and stress response component 4-like [Amphimedon queenslandica]|eukprot:XP_019848835.1 PREDICTED: cell wall integrity and stress response component 4-like [Amphimedon queenslandica]
MVRRLSSALFLVSVLFYLQGRGAHGGILYANSTNLTLYQENPLRLELSARLRVVCPDLDYGLYRVSQEGYNNCSNDEEELIGHCGNSTGIVSEFIYSVPLPGGLAWEIDMTYYLIFKYTNNGSTAPCDDGYKFQVFVYNSTTVTPTPTVMPMSSSSSVVITSSSSSILSQLLTPFFSQSRIHTVSPSSTETVTGPTHEPSSSSTSEIETTEVRATSTGLINVNPTPPTVQPSVSTTVSGATSTTASLTLALSLLALLLILLL